MDYEDDNSYSEDEDYSIYSDYAESQENFSSYDAEIDALVNLCEIHFSQYTPDEISTYICSLHPSTLQTFIHGAYDHSLIKNTISSLRMELENFYRPKTYHLNSEKTIPTKYTKTDYLSAAFKLWKNSKLANKASQLSAIAVEFQPQFQKTTGKVEPNFHTKIPLIQTQLLPVSYCNKRALLPQSEPNQTVSTKQTNNQTICNDRAQHQPKNTG